MADKLNNIFSETECPSKQVLNDYLEDKLSAKEKHDVEKHLIDCEMCADEVEGLSLLKNETGIAAVINDIKAELNNKHIEKKVKIHSLNVWYKVAAAVVILILIASVFLLNDYLKKDETVIVENLKKQTEKANQNTVSVKTETPSMTAEPKEEVKTKRIKEDNKKGFATSGNVNMVGGNSKTTTSNISVLTANEIVMADAMPPPVDKAKEEGIDYKADILINNEEPERKLSEEEIAVTEETAIIKDEESKEKDVDKKAERKTTKIISNTSKSKELQKEQVKPNASYREVAGENEQESLIDEAIKKYEAKEFKDAAELFEKVLKQEPANYNALYYSAVSYFEIHKPDKAIANLDKVLATKQGPFYEAANWYKALAYIEKTDEETAKRILNEIIEQGGTYKLKAEQKLKELE